MLSANTILEVSVFFGVFISLAAYGIGVLLKAKTGLAIFNPLLVAIILTILVLAIFHIDTKTYQTGANLLSYLLTPATVCLAIPLYEQFHMLKKNWVAIMIGIVTGVITSMTSILILAMLFGFAHEEYVTFLPKSITTAIGMSVSEQFGGYVSVTVCVIIITGVLGNIIAEKTLKLFHITDPVAKGIAIGSASHAIGTAKAMEIGEVEGAMSSLSIVVSGIITVVFASFYVHFL